MTHQQTEKEFKDALIDMYVAPMKNKMFTPQQLEKQLDILWKNELEIRRLDKQALDAMNTFKNVLFFIFILVVILFVTGSCFILKPTPKNHVKPTQESNVPFTKVF